jgi:hypothetical protein
MNNLPVEVVQNLPGSELPGMEAFPDSKLPEPVTPSWPNSSTSRDRYGMPHIYEIGELIEVTKSPNVNPKPL